MKSIQIKLGWLRLKYHLQLTVVTFFNQKSENNNDVYDFVCLLH